MTNKHPFHLVNPSPWPLLNSISLLCLTISIVMYFHGYIGGLPFLLASLLLVSTLAAFWWRDLIRESTYLRIHTNKALTGLKLGFFLFLISETMFFFGFFWSFFHSSLSPTIEIGCQWPPYELNVIYLTLPTINTLLLLSSGAAITLAHLALINRNKLLALDSLLVTIAFAIIFTGIQVYEYIHAPFSISDGIYGSVFYLLTGFHGLHVLIGTIFILTQIIRLIKGHLTHTKHMAFEMSLWYWHFVDLIWVLLYILIYAYGSYTL